MLKTNLYYKKGLPGCFSRSIWVTSFLLVFLSAPKMSAQQELMLHSLPDIWHSNATNPSFFSANKHFALGLPGVSLVGSQSGNLTYNDIFHKEGDRTIVDFSNALDKMDLQNTVLIEQRIETVSLGLLLPGKIWLQAGHANRVCGSITYPKTLPALIWEGNAPYIGQTVDIAMQAKLSNWNEWSVGFAKDFGKFKLGFRAKFLYGIAALMTDDAHKTATVTTSDDIYQLTLATDYGFHSSSLISSIDTTQYGFDVKFGKYNSKLFSKNKGLALDIGGQYKLNESVTLDFSLLDLGGKIKWKEESNYLISQGSYEYEGGILPGEGIIEGWDSLDLSLKLDTINDIFNFQKKAEEFTTTIPFRLYAGGQYELNKKISFGLSTYFQKSADEKGVLAIGASARWKPLNWCSIGAMYSVNKQSAANLGLHLVLTPGPLQVYFTSDDVLYAFSIKNSSKVNFRAGISLIF